MFRFESTRKRIKQRGWSSKDYKYEAVKSVIARLQKEIAETSGITTPCGVLSLSEGLTLHGSMRSSDTLITAEFSDTYLTITPHKGNDYESPAIVFLIEGRLFVMSWIPPLTKPANILDLFYEKIREACTKAYFIRDQGCGCNRDSSH